MYVCLCASIKEEEVRQAVRKGLRSLDDFRVTMKMCIQCGCCAQHVQQLIAEERQRFVQEESYEV
jgi:bacterioferritin-associated ferredoxin